MRFSPWFSLEELTSEDRLADFLVAIHGVHDARTHQLCVVQIKGQKLESYPKGRSAMLWYGWGPLDRVIHDAQRLLPTGGLVRALAHPDPEAQCARLLRRFVSRFGTPPTMQDTSFV